MPFFPRKCLLSVLFFVGSLLSSHTIFAQQDSITNHYDSLAKIKLQHLDSSSNRFNTKVDSIQQRLNNFLNPNINLSSKVQPKTKLEIPDSLRATHELDSIKRNFTHKIDSLKSLNLPTDKYTRKLDSLKTIGPAKYIELTKNKIGAAESNVNKSISNLESKINSNIPGELNKNIAVDKVNLPNAKGLPNTNIDTKITGVDNPLKDLNNPLGNNTNPLSKATDLQNLPQQELGKVTQAGQINELNSAKDKLGDLNQVTDKAQSYTGEVKNIANGDLTNTDNLEKTIENKASNISEVKDLQKQTGEMSKGTQQIDEIKGMANKANDPDAMKTMAKQEIQKQAINHFKGKEQVLQQAMDKMNKLKAKYPEISSMKDLAKRPPNPLKGKPLIERIIPGVTIQVQKTHNVAIDINPVVSYRFTTRINAGAGWNERFAFTKWNKLSSSDRIYGPRVFGSFGFKKGFAAKAEIEKMNTLIPASSITSTDASRQWVWSVFVGLKKDYRFAGRVKGNMQVLYNLYDDHYNSPYTDKLNVRLGFEFPMKKRTQKRVAVDTQRSGGTR